MIKEGLIKIINEKMERIIKEAEGEGKMIIIADMMISLTKNNIEAGRIIVEETNFIERFLSLISSHPLNKVKEGHLSPLLSLINNLTNELKR